MPKICGTIWAKTNEEAVRALEDKSHLVDLVELRLDLIENPDPAKLLARKMRPVICACRSTADGGNFQGPPEAQSELLKKCSKAGADYVDLDLRLVEFFAADRPGRLISSYHNFEETPEDLPAIWRQLARQDPSVIKLVTMPRRAGDARRLLGLCRPAEIPTIGFALGEAGLFTRFAGLLGGAPWIYGALHGSPDPRTAQPAVEELLEVYRIQRLEEHFALYGVAGNPVRQSLGPLFFNRLFEIGKVPALYLPLLVRSEHDLKSLLELPQIEGLSVTHPWKFEAAHGAAGGCIPANTMTRAGARWIGRNTDGEGAVLAFADAYRHRHGVSPPWRRWKALVLGTGGVGQAVALALKNCGASVCVTNRSESRGESFAQEAALEWLPPTSLKNFSADLLVQATSVGMVPETDRIPFEDKLPFSWNMLLELVYRPRETALVREARKRGAFVVDGLEVYFRQALLQYGTWFGELPEQKTQELWNWLEGASRDRDRLTVKSLDSGR